MKLILTETPPKIITILLKDVNLSYEHIAVANREGIPVIVTLNNDRASKPAYWWQCVNTPLTSGNRYGPFNSIEEALSSKFLTEIQVFKYSDWKKALQWLIDNC